MPETLKLTPNASLEIRESSPELLEVEASYGPGGDPPPAHLHPEQDERFEVPASTPAPPDTAAAGAPAE
jgi:hypothetical protein